MKWYHFQEGGAVPKPGYSPTQFLNQYTSNEYAGDPMAGLTAASKELYSLDNKYNRAADAFRTQRALVGDLQAQQQQLQGDYDTLQGDYTGLQGQQQLLQGQYDTLQGDHASAQEQAAIDQALAVDQARRKALSERRAGQVLSLIHI